MFVHGRLHINKSLNIPAQHIVNNEFGNIIGIFTTSLKFLSPVKRAFALLSLSLHKLSQELKIKLDTRLDYYCTRYTRCCWYMEYNMTCV